MKKVTALLLVIMILGTCYMTYAEEGIIVFPKSEIPEYITEVFQRDCEIRADTFEEFEFLRDIAQYGGKGMLKCIVMNIESGASLEEGEIQYEEMPLKSIAYAIANGLDYLPKDEEIPAGVKFNVNFMSDGEEAYLIKDDSVISKEYPSNYIIKNGGENQKHYITTEGWIFVLPGYRKVLPDDTVIYLVNELGEFYVEGDI